MSKDRQRHLAGKNHSHQQGNDLFQERNLLGYVKFITDNVIFCFILTYFIGK